MRLRSKKTKMQVAWISDSFEQINGVSTYIKNILPLLNKQLDIKLFTGRVTNDYEFPVFSMPHISFPFLPEYDIISPFFKKIDANLIHVHSAYLLGLRSSRLDMKKIVTTHFHPYNFLESFFGQNQPKIFRDLMWRYIIWFLNQFDIVITQTRAKEKTFKTQGLKTRIEVVPNGMDMSKSIEHTELKVDFRKKFGIRGDFALFLGRLDASKRPDWVIEVAKRLPHRQFVIIGRGTLEKKLSHPKNVHFIRKYISAEDKIGAYHSASMILMPSAVGVEMEGLVAQEAMLCKTPVLHSDDDVLNEVVGKGGIACRSIEELKEKTELLFEDNELREELGERALEAVGKRDINKSVEKLIKIYDSL